MMVLVHMSAALEGDEIRSSWPTVNVARLYCEREARAPLRFRTVSLGIWEARTAGALYRIVLGQPFQERDLITAAALLQL